MTERNAGGNRLEVHPLTPDRWADLEALFTSDHSPNECWCMWWRETRAEWDRLKGEGNRLALKRIVDSGEAPGLVAYADGRPAGWVSVGPRESFPRLNRSPVLRRVDDRPAWSIVCFFVAESARGIGLLPRLTVAARDFAVAGGAKIVEAYPHDRGGRLSALSAYMGVLPVLEKAGFVDVLRRSPVQPVMRYYA